MKKKLTAIILATALTLSLAGCGSQADASSVARDKQADTSVVYIDDEAIALAGSALSAEEQQRADELRAMAVEAFDLINAERVNAGLPAFVWDDDLELCALVRASELPANFSHTRPNGTDWYTVDSNLMWGENVAKGYEDAAGVVSGWMNSASHKANIMDAEFVTCTIGIYEANGTLFFAQEFGF